MWTVAASAVALLALAPGCTDYTQIQSATRSIWEVHVTTEAADVSGCRFLERVDSRDSAKGCGVTVQPTPEECLRYQVRRAGGDTLLMRGPAGDAYDCSGGAAKIEEAVTPAPSAAPAPSPTSAPPPPPSPTERPAPAAPPAGTRPTVRVTADREAARGCVYLGDVPSGIACADENGLASTECGERALEAGGDLILRDAAGAQIFSCKARP